MLLNLQGCLQGAHSICHTSQKNEIVMWNDGVKATKALCKLHFSMYYVALFFFFIFWKFGANNMKSVDL